MKDKVIELREDRGLLTRFLLIQQKRPEIMNLEEAIGEYEFSAVPRSLFSSDGTLLLPSDKYELMKQTENIAVANPQNMDEYQTTPESTYRADVKDAMVQVQAMKRTRPLRLEKTLVMLLQSGSKGYFPKVMKKESFLIDT